jgi:hypothetical protein
MRDKDENLAGYSSMQHSRRPGHCQQLGGRSPMSVILRMADSSRTSRHFRKGPISDFELNAGLREAFRRVSAG